jgi:hypothetical protein
MINELGAVGGIIIGMRNRSNRWKTAPVLIFHHNSHFICLGIKLRPPQWEDGV